MLLVVWQYCTAGGTSICPGRNKSIDSVLFSGEMSTVFCFQGEMLTMLCFHWPNTEAAPDFGRAFGPLQLLALAQYVPGSKTKTGLRV